MESNLTEAHRNELAGLEQRRARVEDGTDMATYLDERMHSIRALLGENKSEGRPTRGRPRIVRETAVATDSIETREG